MNRDILITKREDLLKKRALRDRLQLIEDVTTYLDQQGIPHGIEFDDKYSFWVRKNYPVNFSGINWEEVPGSFKLSYSNPDERDQILVEVLANNLNLDELVAVIWSNASRPVIEVKLDAVIDCPSIFADQDFDMWIVPYNKGFCLECYHEGYIGYTKNS